MIAYMIDLHLQILKERYRAPFETVTLNVYCKMQKVIV